MIRVCLVVLMFCLPAAAANADAQAVRDAMIAELRTEGFNRIRVSRTLLGRVRLVAERPGEQREIVISPTSGQVLRDHVRRSDKGDAVGSAGGSDAGQGGSGVGGSSNGNGNGGQGNAGNGNGGNGNGGPGNGGNGNGGPGNGGNGNGNGGNGNGGNGNGGNGNGGQGGGGSGGGNGGNGDDDD